VAKSLYASGDWTEGNQRVRLVVVGRDPSSDLTKAYPLVRQLLWNAEILPFIHERFWSYRCVKI
jgi:hypothetical protein